MDFSRLPKVDRVVEAPELEPIRRALGRRVVTALARESIASARERVRTGAAAPGLDEVVRQVREGAEKRLHSPIQAVINATGVLLHTNLGRAPLPAASLARIAEVGGRYSTLELDAETGVRTRRGLAVEAALAELTGAEDALLVNNNAAAVLLTLSTIAAGREVIVSRGELVEIGGGFRIPEVLARSGARLVEVGTTNRTRVEDYARAIGESTACLLRVHPSNFRITGFAERPALRDLADLARARSIPLIKDLGGGLLVDLSATLAGSDLALEPTVQACLARGAHLVCFSLDKLFGGPQGGAIVGETALVHRLREDPLARALRVDKVTLAAIEPLLDAYRRGALSEIPIHAMLGASVDELEARVTRWQAALGEHGKKTRIVRTEAAIGGGTLAEAPVASAALAIESPNPESLAQALRSGHPPILARIVDDRVVLDARTVLPDEDERLVDALVRIFSSAAHPRSEP